MSWKRARGFRKVLHDNGLSFVMLGLFLVFLVGQSLTGWKSHEAEQRLHGGSASGYWKYVVSGDFVESVFENWESEFLQMGGFVLLAARFKQRGSGESKDPDGPDESDEDPAKEKQADSPWPVHRGGVALALYSHSLTIALFGIFALSFVLHGLGGLAAYNQELSQHGRGQLSFLAYLGSSRFWFESFQNWQSEFLSVGALIVLSAVLRERGSPESKRVAAPHGDNE